MIFIEKIKKNWRNKWIFCDEYFLIPLNYVSLACFLHIYIKISETIHCYTFKYILFF